MPDTIALTGVVATVPRHVTTAEGLAITSFRLASSQRRFDRTQNAWIDVGTNWYTITAFRQLAANLATSVNKGDRVVTAGRLRIRDWEAGEKSGTTVEVEADSVGHDLSWGTTSFRRSSLTEPSSSEPHSSEQFASERSASLSSATGSGGFLPAEEDNAELLHTSPVLDSTLT